MKKTKEGGVASEKELKKEPVKVLTLTQEPRKKSVKVFDYKTGTENRIDCLKLVSPSYSCKCILQRV